MDDFVAAAPEHRRQRLVDLHPPAVEMSEREPDLSGLERRPQALLARGDLIHLVLGGGRGFARVPCQLVHRDRHRDEHRREQDRGGHFGSLTRRRQGPDQNRDRGHHRHGDGLGAVLLERNEEDDRQVERECDHRVGAGERLDREDSRQRGKRRGSANQDPRPRGGLRTGTWQYP